MSTNYIFDHNLQVNVLTSNNCRDRINNINNTWGKHIKDLVFFSNHEDINNKVLNVSPDSDSCEMKSLNRAKQIFESDINKDWYFFVDDDTCINFNALSEFITTHDKTKIYGRFCSVGDWKYIQGGAGILIPGELLSKASKDTVRFYGCSDYSDLWWGNFFEKNNFELSFHDSIFCAWEHEVDLNIIQNIVAVHPIKTQERMQHYNELFDNEQYIIKNRVDLTNA
jgi:hypothetical protein